MEEKLLLLLYCVRFLIYFSFLRMGERREKMNKKYDEKDTSDHIISQLKWVMISSLSQKDEKKVKIDERTFFVHLELCGLFSCTYHMREIVCNTTSAVNPHFRHVFNRMVGFTPF